MSGGEALIGGYNSSSGYQKMCKKYNTVGKGTGMWECYVSQEGKEDYNLFGDNFYGNQTLLRWAHISEKDAAFARGYWPLELTRRLDDRRSVWVNPCSAYYEGQWIAGMTWATLNICRITDRGAVHDAGNFTIAMWPPMKQTAWCFKSTQKGCGNYQDDFRYCFNCTDAMYAQTNDMSCVDVTLKSDANQPYMSGLAIPQPEAIAATKAAATPTSAASFLTWDLPKSDDSSLPRFSGWLHYASSDCSGAPNYYHGRASRTCSTSASACSDSAGGGSERRACNLPLVPAEASALQKYMIVQQLTAPSCILVSQDADASVYGFQAEDKCTRAGTASFIASSRYLRYVSCLLHVAVLTRS